jgi:hypothetical protein
MTKKINNDNQKRIEELYKTSFHFSLFFNFILLRYFFVVHCKQYFLIVFTIILLLGCSIFSFFYTNFQFFKNLNLTQLVFAQPPKLYHIDFVDMRENLSIPNTFSIHGHHQARAS